MKRGRKPKLHSSWTTKNEINFIKGLGMGTWASDSAKVRSKSRLELLKSYYLAAKNRDSWEGVDKHEVLGFAAEEIRHLGGTEKCPNCGYNA